MCRHHASNTAATLDKAKNLVIPGFTEDLVAANLPDGYWLEAFPFSTKSEFPDLVGYGLGFADQAALIKLYTNPLNSNAVGWSLDEIQKLEFPVAMTYADLTGDGFNDIIICDRYGPGMGDLWDAKTQDGGRVLWLKNPGSRASTGYWEAKKIGNSTGMHRLKVGHFTTRTQIQIIAIPVIPKSSDLTSPAPIIIYTPEYGDDKTQGPKSWKSDIAFSSEFRLIHDVKIVHSASKEGLDMAVVAGREGTVALWFEGSKWHYNVIGAGGPEEKGNPYWGSGSVDVAAVGDDPVGYIATCEAFHGNTVAVYVKKDPKAHKGPESLKDSSLWTRIVVDYFGPLNEEHTGTIHHVATGDFTGSGVDSFAIACMGAPIGNPANQGVYLYTPYDIVRGIFAKTKVTNESAGRIALAKYFSPALDVGSISYYVPGYHTGPDPPSIRINSQRILSHAASTSISVIRLDQEALIRVPRPAALSSGSVPTLPTIEIAGKKLSVVVLPPNTKVKYKPVDGLKVIYGEVHMINESKKTVVRRIAPAARKQDTFRIISDDGVVTAGPDGAVFLLVAELDSQFQGPFKAMDQLPTTNVFPPTAPLDVRALQLPFKKVETLSWATESGLWNDFQFYNLTGFHVYFNDDALEEICHVQLWTLGLGETARFHNHYDKSFCEIHACISNGGGHGGMRWFKDGENPPTIDTDAELKLDWVEEHSDLLVVPSMAEHGPLWFVQKGSEARPVIRPNATVDYPWHAWLASDFGKHKLPIKPPLPDADQKYDVWLAFEFPASAFQF